MTDKGKKFIRKWVKALRSGKYIQGTGRLRVGDSYCCLGVACDISGLGEWVKGEGNIARGYTYKVFSDNGQYPLAVSYIPFVLVNKLGLGLSTLVGDKVEPPGATTECFIQDSLVELNDSYGLSFEGIAAELEKRFLK